MLNSIQIEHLKHVYELLESMAEFFDNGTAINPGALLLDDPGTVQEHVEMARDNVREILEGGDYAG